MNITVKSNPDDEVSYTITQIINSFYQNIEYTPESSDFSKIHSFTNYVMSRYIDKISSIAVTYLRIKWTLSNLDFEDIKEMNLPHEQAIVRESSIELAASILRPLLEIYIDVKAIELCDRKFQIDYESSCQLLYFDALNDLNNLKKSVSREFYCCEPKYYSLFSDIFSKEVNTLKQRLSNKNVLLLKNIKNKYKELLENFGNSERLALGFDYFTHYAILSKKTHFAYINQSVNLSAEHYLNWSILYIVLIYQQLMKLVNKEDKILQNLKTSIEHFVRQSSQDIRHNFEIGNYIFFDYGVAEVIGLESLTYKIRYYISNIFETNETDVIPRFAMGIRVDKQIVDNVKSQYYSADRKIYNDDNFEKLYQEIHKTINN